MTKSEKIIELTNHYGAHNYLPLPIVISEAEGVWVKDPEGNKYMDMLSAYSAVNQGHRHPKIIQALKDQADKVTLVSRAFHSDNLGEWYEKICKLAGKDKALPMNTGAEAVETALKAARRWATMLKELSQIKQKSLHLMVTSMVEQWRQFHYLQKQNTNVVMVRY
ncbi:Ornithine aminotransferase [Staphylococcus aureus]|nr:Ornithine aminotransferase [Staphylococcus aureus]